MVFKIAIYAWVAFLCIQITVAQYKRSRIPSFCSLEPETGPCEALIQRYYYKPDTGTCEIFTYGGCQGNSNNFQTQSECLGTCASNCNAPAVTGPCKAYFPSYYFNPSSGTCEQFIYGGCGGNSNRYETREECLKTCAPYCFAPPESGPCLALFPRFYYNPATQTCESFVYGGCLGNENNFEEKTDCLNKCAPICSQEKQPGLCLAYFPRYYYDSESNTCKSFIYGGCGGNGNNFETFDDCNQQCETRCYQPQEIGPCDGAFPRYFYNVDTGRCERFSYGGCQGNDNNFETYRECCSACHPQRQYYEK